MKTMKIDDIDKKILNAILEDSKLPFREIANIVGVSSVTCLKRVNRLKKHGIIKSYTTELDYDKLGYEINVLIKIRISNGKLFEVENKIANDPHVFSVYDTTGNFDATVIARFKNRKSFDSFLKKIQTIEFIERTESLFILNTIKEKNITIN